MDWNRLLPIGFCITTVSPSMLMNRCGPSHPSVTCLFTSTGDPAENSLSLADVSTPLGPPQGFRPNDILRFSCYFSTSYIAASIVFARSSWLMEADVRAGLAKAPNTKRIVHSPYGPTVAFNANTAIFMHSWSDLPLHTSVRMRSESALSGALYLPTLPIAPGVSIGDYSILTPFY